MNFNRVVCIDFRYCKTQLIKKIPWILAAITVGAFLGIFISILAVKPENSYRASAVVYSYVKGSYDESALGLDALKVYSEVVKSRKIAEEARKLLKNTDLTVDEIYNMISTDDRFIQGSTYIYENESAVLHIYADSSSEADSTVVVNAVADAFVTEINKIFMSDTVQVLDYAARSEKTYDFVQQKIIITVAMAICSGGIYIICLLISIIFSSKIITVKDMDAYGQLTILGVIPDYKEQMR